MHLRKQICLFFKKTWDVGSHSRPRARVTVTIFQSIDSRRPIRIFLSTFALMHGRLHFLNVEKTVFHDFRNKLLFLPLELD